MSMTRTILIRSFVKPFYQQNAGMFIFLFIVLFGAVGMVDGAGLQAFHFSLTQGMLKNTILFLLVFFIWFLYARKTTQFISGIMHRPDFRFLEILSQLESRKLYWILAWMQFLLFIPIVFYIIIILVTGIYLQAWFPCLFILIYLLLLIGFCAGKYTYMIQNPGESAPTMYGLFAFKSRPVPYWSIFIRYAGEKKKILIAGIKIYTCATLCLMVVNQTPVEYDLTMIFLFFSIGILGHGLLIHKFRHLEEARLTFYRSLPISVSGRFKQYCLLYFMLLIPEFATVAILTPKYLHWRDALIFVFFSYSALLFLNSLLFVQFFRMQDYLKIILCLFLITYISILTVSLPLFCSLLFLSSMGLFFRGYYQFER